MSTSEPEQRLFAHVHTKKRGSLVADQILEAVKSGQLQPGDPLPSERDLALQTGISRPSVREAISALELIGVVECHPGHRTLVTNQARDAALLSAALPDLHEGDQLQEALELRRVIEVSSIRLLLARRTRETMNALGSVLDDMSDATERRSFEDYNEANLRFHEVLAKATGNSLLERILHPLMNLMLGNIVRELRKHIYVHEPEFFDRNLAAHRRIAESYSKGDEEELIAAIENHYDLIAQSL